MQELSLTFSILRCLKNTILNLKSPDVDAHWGFCHLEALLCNSMAHISKEIKKHLPALTVNSQRREIKQIMTGNQVGHTHKYN